MFRSILKSKIHRASVTEANLYYEGSITIDEKLMKAADIAEYEKIEVLNLNNGRRLETYAIKGEAYSGMVCLNGAAARGACAGDKVIILSYVFCDSQDSIKPPIIVKVDEENRIKD